MQPSSGGEAMCAAPRAAPPSHLGFQLNHVHALFTSHKRTGSLAYDGASTMLMTMATATACDEDDDDDGERRRRRRPTPRLFIVVGWTAVFYLSDRNEIQR